MQHHRGSEVTTCNTPFLKKNKYTRGPGNELLSAAAGQQKFVTIHEWRIKMMKDCSPSPAAGGRPGAKEVTGITGHNNAAVAAAPDQ